MQVFNYLKPYIVGNQEVSSSEVFPPFGSWQNDQYGDLVISTDSRYDQQVRAIYESIRGSAWNTVRNDIALRNKAKKLFNLVNEESGLFSKKTRGNILDFGCGCPALMKELSRYSDNCYYTGFDIGSEDVILVSNNIKLVRSNNASVLCKQEYDCIFLMNVYEHIQEIDSILSLLRSLLKHDGILVVETGNYESFWARVNGCNWHYFRIHEHIRVASPNSMGNRLSAHGFRVKCIMKNLNHKDPATMRQFIKHWFRITLALWFRILSLLPIIVFTYVEKRSNFAGWRDHMIVLAIKK